MLSCSHALEVVSYSDQRRAQLIKVRIAGLYPVLVFFFFYSIILRFYYEYTSGPLSQQHAVK